MPSRRRPAAVTIARRAHILDLAGGAEVVWKGFSDSRRRAVRKAERAAVEVECDTTGRLLPEFFDLYARSERRWAQQQHEPVWLARLRTRFRDTVGKWQQISRHLDGGCRQWVARHDGRAVASIIVLFGVNAHYTRGAMDKELAGPVRANDLLMWHAIQAACAIGAGSFHLGESGSSASLSDYKERFGARAFDYPELRLERLPITRLDTRCPVGGQARDRIPRRMTASDAAAPASVRSGRDPGLGRGPPPGPRRRAPAFTAPSQRRRPRRRDRSNRAARRPVLGHRRPAVRHRRGRPELGADRVDDLPRQPCPSQSHQRTEPLRADRRRANRKARGALVRGSGRGSPSWRR